MQDSIAKQLQSWDAGNKDIASEAGGSPDWTRSLSQP